MRVCFAALETYCVDTVMTVRVWHLCDGARECDGIGVSGNQVGGSVEKDALIVSCSGELGAKS